MLPGLRFLFVAIVLSTSALIFGLGAAALLRSAHEEFSNLPNRRAPPETVFAQPVEASRPTLAVLRVEAPVTAQKDIAPPAAPNEPNPAPALEQPSPMASPEPDRTAAEPANVATPVATAPPEEKSEASEKPSSDQSSETPEQVETPARGPTQPLDQQALETEKLETRAATTAATTAPATATSAPTSAEAIVAAAPPPVTVPAPMPASIGESANGASDKIATLGGPAVTIEPAPRVAVDHPARRAHPAEIVHVRRPLKRHRILHARAAPPPPVAFGAFQTPPAAAGSTRQN